MKLFLKNVETCNLECKTQIIQFINQLTINCILLFQLLNLCSNYYIAVFAKIGNIMFFRRFAFFSPESFSQPSVGRFAPNLARSVVWHAIYTESSALRKVQKPGHNGEKTSKNRPNFHTRRHVFARCDKTVKLF